MSFPAKVYKVMIASPSDTISEREIVRRVLSRWNARYAEEKHIILLPIGWDTDSAPDAGIQAQDYLNKTLVDQCDVLIGIFYSRIGTETRNSISGTVEEVFRNIDRRRPTMVYFSKKPLPPDVDLTQQQKLREFKAKMMEEGLCGEYSSDSDFEKQLYDHIQIKIQEQRIRPIWDSDIISYGFSNDDERIAAINAHTPLVAKNVLLNIVDEAHKDELWEAIIEKLKKSYPDFRDALIQLALRGAFKHPVYKKGVVELSREASSDSNDQPQPNFGVFINNLYSINRYEFWDLIDQKLLKPSRFTYNILEKVLRDENRLDQIDSVFAELG